MKLIEKKYYTADNCSLIIKIIKIYYSDDEIYKVKASLFYKGSLDFVETKNFKIQKQNISHWKIYNEISE